MAYEYNAGGTAVTDKPVYLTKAVTLGGQSLYMGRVSGLAAHSVTGTSSATYGLWANPAKVGTRFRVVTTGVPGSSADVLWDLQSGRLYSTVSRTVYARYYKYADLMNEGRVYEINIPFMLTGTVGDVTRRNCPWDVKWGEYSIAVDGNRPTGTLSLGVYKVTGGTGTHATLTLGGTARTTTGFTTISGGLSMDTADKIVIRNSTSNSGFSGLTITLREALE